MCLKDKAIRIIQYQAVDSPYLYLERHKYLLYLILCLNFSYLLEGAYKQSSWLWKQKMSAIKGLSQTAGHIKNARLATYTHNTNKHKSGPASSARKKPRIFTVSILIHSNTKKMEYPKVS